MTEQLVITPNCPEGRVCLVAAADHPEITSSLRNEGIRVLSFRNSSLSEEVSSHSDMLLCHTGDCRIFLDPQQNQDSLRKEGFSILTSAPLKQKYPEDVKLNAAIGKGFIICNPETIDSLLFRYITMTGVRVYKVKQGYTKCSVCFVTENAVITEDPSVEAALKDTDIDVLTISKGDIYLSGQHYGFFGGSSGKIDKNTLAVTGEMKYHRDGQKITDFCNRHGVKIKELKKGQITDIGGILPLKEMRL